MNKLTRILNFLFDVKYETNENVEYCINGIQKTYSDKIVNHGNLMGEVNVLSFLYFF